MTGKQLSMWQAPATVHRWRPRRASTVLASLSLAIVLSSQAWGQRVPETASQTPRDTAEKPDVYPIGEAVAVYRAVLDLLYVDGKRRPDLIVLHDTARRQSGGPCPRPCPQRWPHKSKIDSATILAYARPRLGTPRIIGFGYKIPIRLVTTDDFERIRHEGIGYLANFPQDQIGPAEAFWTGFRRRFPGAWGHVMLGTVAFDSKQTEALIGVRQACGEYCSSFETIFLKRIRGKWRVIERIPEEVQIHMRTSGNLRYRGPAGENPQQSQIFAVDRSGTPGRPESEDAIKIYHAVLDRLYSFYGERPRTLVITENHSYAPKGVPRHRSAIDPKVVATYDFFAQVTDAVHRFKYRLPIAWVSQESLQQLERDGVQLAKAAAARGELEQSSLWLAFNSKYPGAWGYLSLGRVAFNPRHTQALVFTHHSCGSSCVTADTWLLERKGESWRIVERMPRDNQTNWGLDGLRYLGPGVDPRTYRSRRVQGVITNAETNLPLARLKVEAVLQNNKSRFVTTDSAGRYVLNNLPLGGFAMKLPCRNGSPPDSIQLHPVVVTPGLDSTVNFSVNFSFCPQRSVQREPELAPNAPRDAPVDVTHECMLQEMDLAIRPYIAEARASWPKARARYLAGLPAGHSFFVTALLVDDSDRREQVFIAVDEIHHGTISGRIWNRIGIVRGYNHGDRYRFAEAELRDWTITRPDGTEEGNFVGKFLETYEPRGTCESNSTSE